MAARAFKTAGSTLNPAAKLWWAKSEVWPVIACIGIAVGWCGYMSGRALILNPDVSIAPARRGSPLKEEIASEADNWKASHLKHYPKDVRDISIFGSYERRYN